MNTSEIELHPEAKQNYDQRAEALIGKLSAQDIPRQMEQSAIQPDIVVHHTITEKDIIGDVLVNFADGQTGERTGRGFLTGGKKILLEGEGWRELSKLSSKVAQTPNIREKVSASFIEDVTFLWIKARYEKSTSVGFSDHLVSEIIKAVVDQEIWIPIAKTQIDGVLEIGRVKIQPISKQVFDSWRESMRLPKPEEDAKVEQLFDKFRRKLQGYAAARIVVSAEPARARKIAEEETEKALAVLRWMSPEIQLPRKPSFCAILGREYVPSFTHFILREGRVSNIHQGEFTAAVPTGLGRDVLALFQKPLAMVNDLLREPNPSEFQSDLIDAFILYSQSSLKDRITDRLITILVSLESLLLKDSSEAIQQNLGERMALVCGSNLAERKAVRADLGEVYRIRSRFIHHGDTVEDVDAVQKFLRHAFVFFYQMIQAHRAYKTRNEFIAALDDRKMS